MTYQTKPATLPNETHLYPNNTTNLAGQFQRRSHLDQVKTCAKLGVCVLNICLVPEKLKVIPQLSLRYQNEITRLVRLSFNYIV